MTLTTLDAHIQSLSGRRFARLALMAIIVAIGFGLRAYRLESQNAWYDEGYSVFMARLPLDELPRSIATDGHPFVYFALLHGWRALTGESLYAYRFLSVLFGVLALAVGYRLVHQVAGPSIAALATALFAVHRASIWYSQEIRMYGLAMLWALVALTCALSWTQRGRWRSLVGYGLAVSAGLQTLYLFMLAPIALNLAVIPTLVDRLRRGGRRDAINWLVTQCLTVLSVLPWALYAFPLRPRRFTAATPVGPLEIAGLWLNTWLVGTATRIWDDAPTYAVVLVTLALVGWAAWRSRQRPTRGAAYFLWANIAGAVTTIGLVWFLNVPSPFQMTFTPAPRYLLALIPWAVLGLGAALGWLATQRRAMGGVVALGMLALIAWPLPAYFNARSLTDFYRSAALTLDSYRQPGDALLLHNDSNWPVVDFDLGTEPRAGVSNGLAIDDATAEQIAQPLWQAHEGVWLLLTRESLLNDFDGRVLKWFQEHAVASTMWDFSPGAQLWLFARTADRAASMTRLEQASAFRETTIQSGLALAGVQAALPEAQVGETFRLFLYWRSGDDPQKATLAVRLRGLWGGTADEIPLVVEGPGGTIWRQQVDFPIRPYVGPGLYQVELTTGIGGSAIGPVLADLPISAALPLPAPAEVLSQATHVVFQNGLALEAWDATHSEDGLTVRVQWQVLSVVDRQAKQFWHLVGPDDSVDLRAQVDAEPLGSLPPMTAWPVGARVQDVITFQLPEDLPHGRYTILTGLYNPISGVRLPVLEPASADNVVRLGTVELP